VSGRRRFFTQEEAAAYFKLTQPLLKPCLGREKRSGTKLAYWPSLRESPAIAAESYDADGVFQRNGALFVPFDLFCPCAHFIQHIAQAAVSCPIIFISRCVCVYTFQIRFNWLVFLFPKRKNAERPPAFCSPSRFLALRSRR